LHVCWDGYLLVLCEGLNEQPSLEVSIPTTTRGNKNHSSNYNPRTIQIFRYSLKKGKKTKSKLQLYPNKEQRRGLGCSLVVQHLPSIHKALGSIPAPKKKRQKKKKEEERRDGKESS
jgi:hypothetical protein